MGGWVKPKSPGTVKGVWVGKRTQKATGSDEDEGQTRGGDQNSQTPDSGVWHREKKHPRMFPPGLRSHAKKNAGGNS